jgi:hypothetical protein
MALGLALSPLLPWLIEIVPPGYVKFSDPVLRFKQPGFHSVQAFPFRLAL